MAARILSIAAALGLLIASSAFAVAQNSITGQEPGAKIPEKALMDPKVGGSNDVQGHLTQENGTSGAAFATAQGTAGPTDTANPGLHQ